MKVWARPKNSNLKPEVSLSNVSLSIFDPWGLVFVENLLNTGLFSSNTLKIVLKKIIRLPSGIQLWWQANEIIWLLVIEKYTKTLAKIILCKHCRMLYVKSYLMVPTLSE
jgi:hypothetical protein